MPVLKINQFGGIRPKADKRLLGAIESQVANNTYLKTGALVPFKDKAAVSPNPLTKTGVRSIYPYNGGWLDWDTDVDVVKGPLSDDQYNRIYYTGDGKPKVRAVIDGTEREFDLGIPAPTSAPTLVKSVWVDWPYTMEWHYFYEEPDGTKVDQDNVLPLSVSDSTNPDYPINQGYYVIDNPGRQSASQDAIFIPYLRFYTESGAYLGATYPQQSIAKTSSDFVVGGQKASLNVLGSEYWDALDVGGINEFIVQLTWGNSSASSSGSSETKVSRRYVYTFVSEMGEEGPPSPPSALIETTPMTVISARCTASNYQQGNISTITKKRIYRTVTSTAGTEYQYVGEMDVAELSFRDLVTDIEVGETIPTIGWDPPPEDMEGIITVPGGFMAGFSCKTVYFSEPNYPHAWPAVYGLTVDADIVGLGISGNVIVVMTKEDPYQITAIDPSTTTMSKTPANQSCVSKRGIVELSGAVVYPSPDGLVVVQNGTALVYSSQIFTKEQWTSYNPSTLLGAIYDNHVFYFSDNMALVFPIFEKTPRVVTIEDRPTAAHYDSEKDTLFLVVNDVLYEWEGGTTNLTQNWRSREIFNPRPFCPVIGRIVANGYPVTLKVRANDIEVLSRTVNTDEAFRLPVLRKEKAWSFEVEADKEVYELLISQSMGDL